MKSEEMTTLDPIERKRTYTFPQTDTVELTNVIAIKVSDSGNHRLKTSDGLLHIVPTGWIHICIDADEWTL